MKTNGNASTLTRLTSAAATSKLVLQPRSAGKATSKTILNRFLVATPLGELEGGQTLYDGENVIEMNKDLEELEQELRRRVVRFWYQKKNGEWREAIGTRRLSLIPEEQHPNGTGHQPDFLVCYWDLERNHWPCATTFTSTAKSSPLGSSKTPGDCSYSSTCWPRPTSRGWCG